MITLYKEQILAKDLAKEFGVSAPFISQQCGKIAKFIANDKVCLELWKSIQESAGGIYGKSEKV